MLGNSPSAQNVEFRDSAFFREHSELPSPEESSTERPSNQWRARARTYNPPPMIFADRGLLVKYGSFITIAEENDCLLYFNRNMRDQVPTPEVFGWNYDQGETFVCMELIPGESLKARWPSLSKEEKDGDLRTNTRVISKPGGPFGRNMSLTMSVRFGQYDERLH